MHHDLPVVPRHAPKRDHTAAAGDSKKNANAIANENTNANATASATAIVHHAPEDAVTSARFAVRSGGTSSLHLYKAT